jgi:hypothetical protein
MCPISTYSPRPYAFEVIGMAGVADTLNEKYPTGWRVIQIVPNPDGARLMILLEQTDNAKAN